MSVSLLFAALFAAATLDPCAPVERAAELDPATAAEYRAVGDAERAAGRRDTAIAAYRAALERDPEDAGSRTALEDLCRAQRRDGAFDRGSRLLRGGDCRAAIAPLDEARQRGDRHAALLEGICLYELREDDRAASLLREAEADPAHRDSARFFLGLVALRAGAAADAIALLDAAAADRRLAPLAIELSRAASRQGRLVLSALAESAWDSNADLRPDGAPAKGSGSADGVAALTASAFLAPLGDRGPYVRASASMRDQLRLDALDLRAGGAGAGWQLSSARWRGRVEYAYDYRDLDGAPYLSAHGATGVARVDLSRSASVGARYSARVESFLTDAAGDYSGVRQAGEADFTVDLGRRWLATAAWRVGRDDARADSLRWWEHGPRLALRRALPPLARLSLEAAWTWREYDAEDPALRATRADEYADASALLELDVAPRWTLRLGAWGRRALSNLPDFRHAKIVPSVGLQYTLGLL